MCGICGAYGSVDEGVLRKMTDAIKHRGPDEEGYFIDDKVMLGQRRLSIIDLSTGKQPIFNEDRSMAIVYNGEVYNFPALREELERKGHRFYTSTDTEVVLHMFEEYGIPGFTRLNGMFALAIWDLKTKTLVLARDKIGMKPLYYTSVGDNLVFASEVKALLKFPGVRRRLDVRALHQLVNLRCIPRERTMFEDIKRLLPAHYMVIGPGSVKTGEYWQLVPRVDNHTEEYYVKKTRKLIQEAVERHMIADVPIGVYLSGGMDSSTVVAFASQMNDKPLKTFCMGFGEPDDEFPDARIVAEHFGTDHREFTVKASLLKDFPKMIWHAEVPRRDLYGYYIAREVKKHVKVIQSGIGGDELFAGYDFRYRFVDDVMKLRKKLTVEQKVKEAKDAARLIKQQIDGGRLENDYRLKDFRKMRDLEDNADIYLLVASADEVFDEGYWPKIYGPSMLGKVRPVREVFKPFFSTTDDFLTQVLVTDLVVKAADCFLSADDAVSMASSVEVRASLFDDELVDLAFSMPNELKFRNGLGKYVMKKVMAPILPKRCLEKKKQGFASNTFSTFKDELRDYALEMLPDGQAVKLGLFKRNYITRVLHAKSDKNLVMHYNVMWDLVAFELWYRMFMEADEPGEPRAGMEAFL